VSDGLLESTPDEVVLSVGRRIWLPGHVVGAAEYSRPLDRLVTIGSAPDRLYLADPVAGTEVAVELPAPPTALALSPDGLHAAVGHDRSVSYVALALDGPTLEKVIPISTDVASLVLPGDGQVYVFPATDQWMQIGCVSLASGVEVPSTGHPVYEKTRARLHPSGQRIYGADYGISPADLERYDLVGGVASYAYDSPYQGEYEVCSGLWLSEDGQRVFTACGVVFHASELTGAVAGADLTYAGALEATTSTTWVDHSVAAGLVVAAVPGSVLKVFDPETLALLETTPLPQLGIAGQGYPVVGRYAFFSGDGARRIVVVAAPGAPTGPMPWGVVVF